MTVTYRSSSRRCPDSTRSLVVHPANSASHARSTTARTAAPPPGPRPPPPPRRAPGDPGPPPPPPPPRPPRQQLRLVPLHRQQVVPALGADLLGDGGLAAGGVDGHEALPQVERLQQFG